jgi:hypothetical protein
MFLDCADRGEESSPVSDARRQRRRYEAALAHDRRQFAQQDGADALPSPAFAHTRVGA